MKRILVVSRYGDGADLAFRLGLDSNQVRLFIQEPAYQDIGEGLVPKVKAWQPSVSWADMIVFDYSGLSPIWRQVCKVKPCFGGSDWADRLEDDRAFGHEIMRRIGLQSIEALTVKSVDQAAAHIKSHPVPHVVKPMGPKVEKHHTIIGEHPNGEDVLRLLERFKGQKVPFEALAIEEKRHGVEVGLSGWFNGKEWCHPVGINFEHKHSHDREHGYMTSEMGTLMKYVDDRELPFFKDTLDKVAPMLRAVNYRGQIDLNMIVERDEGNGYRAYPLEWTPRFGYPSLFIEDELHVTPWAGLLWDLANGMGHTIQVRYDWAVGVVLASFGFPFDKEYMKASHETPILGLDEHNLEHLHPWQAKLKAGRFVTAGGQGHTLVATGRGENISNAKDKAYSALSSVTAPNSFHRWDISDKISPWELDDLGILEKAS